MKNIILAVLCCMFCVSMTACNDPSPVPYPYEDLKDNVKRVELINYDSRDIKPFNFDKMEIIEELDPEKLDDFLQDLSEMTLWNRPNPDSHVGISIRIIYNNDEFDVMSCNNADHKVISFLARFDSKGKLVKLISSVEDEAEFTDLIDRYFSAQAEQGD